MEREFAPLKIPDKLLSSLPFAAQPKLLAKRSTPSLDTRRKRVIVVEQKERRLQGLMQQLNAIRKEKAKKKLDKARQAQLKHKFDVLSDARKRVSKSKKRAAEELYRTAERPAKRRKTAK